MKDKKQYITLLSVISAFAVIVLHTNGCFWNFSKERYWITANIIESIFYFAVPVFFMISGATLIDYKKKYSTKQYFLKRFKKTVIPFLAWSIIGIIYLLITKMKLISEFDFKYVFEGLFSNTFISIYWFFIPLFSLYLCIPLFSAVEDSSKKKVFSYLALVGFLVNSLIPFVIRVLKLDLNFGIQLNVASAYLLYAIIGYLLDKYELSKKARIYMYISGLIGLLFHIVGTYKLSMDANQIIDTYKGYYNVPCILYSVSIFVFVKELCRKIKIPKIINQLSKYTFAIYLMHFYVMDIFIKLFHINTLSILYRLGMPFVITTIIVLITYIARKIPFIRHIVP